MSKYSKALEQGRRDREAKAKGAAPSPPAEPPVESPAEPAAKPAVEASAAPAPPIADSGPRALPEAERWPAPAPPPPPPVPPAAIVSTPPLVADRQRQREPAEAVAPVLADMDEHLVSLLTPAAIEAEQYRALRHHLEQFRRHKGVQVIGVSSPSMGDGKTTTAINLAGAMAQAVEARVLLLDADLRRPSVRAALGLHPGTGRGLVDAIANPALSLADVAEPLPGFNLSVVGTGELPASPYEVLRSPRVGELLEQARQDFDYVVLDAPPLVAVQDCRLIGHWVDGFLLVVSAHRTPRRQVEEALNVIETSRMLGLVFNGDELPASSYYAGYYGRPEDGGGPVHRHSRRSRLSDALDRVSGRLSAAARRWRAPR